MKEPKSKFQKLNKMESKKGDDEYLVRCVVDMFNKKFYLYSDKGTTKVVDCDNINQFMALLSVVREFLTDDTIGYSEP
jgi:hypothetical protein